jgi:hypothetical protein
MNWAPLLAADAHRKCAASGTSQRPCPLGGTSHPPAGNSWSLGCAECITMLESEKSEKEK